MTYDLTFVPTCWCTLWSRKHADVLAELVKKFKRYLIIYAISAIFITTNIVILNPTNGEGYSKLPYGIRRVWRYQI